MKPLYTIKEISEFFGVSENRIRAGAERLHLPKVYGEPTGYKRSRVFTLQQILDILLIRPSQVVYVREETHFDIVPSKMNYLE